MSTQIVTQLDDALNELADPSETQCELLREHLEAARISLLGEMMEEYALNLGLASSGLNCVADPERRKRLHKLLEELRASKQ